MRRNVVLISCLLAYGTMLAQDLSGTWKTIDDRTGKAKALVRIYVEGDRLYGTITDILVDNMEDARCTACAGRLKDQDIKGMHIINGLKKVGDRRWQGDGDSLFDPEQGKSFRSRIWLDPDEPDVLKVRGYWMFFYRTQYWKRVIEEK